MDTSPATRYRGDFVAWNGGCALIGTLPMRGETLSGAAHAAGFADAAHLSRTARTMFGLPPSALRMNGPLAQRARQARHHFG